MTTADMTAHLFQKRGLNQREAKLLAAAKNRAKMADAQVLSRYTEPAPDQQLLLDRLNLQLPAPPPPRITAALQASIHSAICSADL